MNITSYAGHLGDGEYLLLMCVFFFVFFFGRKSEVGVLLGNGFMCDRHLQRKASHSPELCFVFSFQRGLLDQLLCTFQIDVYRYASRTHTGGEKGRGGRGLEREYERLNQ